MLSADAVCRVTLVRGCRPGPGTCKYHRRDIQGQQEQIKLSGLSLPPSPGQTNHTGSCGVAGRSTRSGNSGPSLTMAGHSSFADSHPSLTMARLQSFPQNRVHKTQANKPPTSQLSTGAWHREKPAHLTCGSAGGSDWLVRPE